MDQREAAEQLQTIRTLMERAALYRRALGPTLVGIGLLGLVAGAVGYLWVRTTTGPEPFVFFWCAVAVLAVGWTAIQVRGQALRAGEPFWTPPTRRVLAAMTPPHAVALLLTLIFCVESLPIRPVVFAVLWMLLYGLGLHAAGHFTLRGFRTLGWGFIVFGLVLTALISPLGLQDTARVHLAMGITFGLGHLAAGGWVLAAERKKVE
jgi:hypothetical protein